LIREFERLRSNSFPTINPEADENMPDHVDQAGRRLDEYPRPSVAVDTAVLSLDPDDQLVVLQVRRPDGPGWALPGTFLHAGERLVDAVRRSLWQKAGLDGVHGVRQLHVFDDPARDERGWVLSVAHVVVLPYRQPPADERTRLVPVHQPGRLWQDHREILRLVVDDLRLRYDDRPDPDGFLGEEFTLRELHRVHQAIDGKILQRDNFRRAMEPRLEPTGRYATGSRGRPAELFRRA
jgi:8-oxo-dGTP diphosphatase